MNFAQPGQPGGRQHGGVGHIVDQLLQPRTHIAAERHDLEIGALPQHLRSAANR